MTELTTWSYLERTIPPENRHPGRFLSRGLVQLSLVAVGGVVLVLYSLPTWTVRYDWIREYQITSIKKLATHSFAPFSGATVTL